MCCRPRFLYRRGRQGPRRLYGPGLGSKKRREEPSQSRRRAPRVGWPRRSRELLQCSPRPGGLSLCASTSAVPQAIPIGPDTADHAFSPSRVAAPDDRNPPFAMFRRRFDQRPLRAVRAVSRPQWYDGYGADSGPSRGDPGRPASRPSRRSAGAAMNARYGRTFAVPGRCWKADVPPNPAVHAVSRYSGSRYPRIARSLPRNPLIAPIMTIALFLL